MGRPHQQTHLLPCMLPNGTTAPANPPAALYVAQWDDRTSKPACCPACRPMGRPHQQTRLLPGMSPNGTAGQTDRHAHHSTLLGGVINIKNIRQTYVSIAYVLSTASMNTHQVINSPINSTRYVMLYPQNGNSFVTIDSVTSLSPHV